VILLAVIADLTILRTTITFLRTLAGRAGERPPASFEARDRPR
jgi:hypothetical protein